MIAYNTYLREDGKSCVAVLFHGNANNETPDHVFEIMEILNAAGLKSYWVDAQETDELVIGEDGYVELDENENLVFKIDPEHLVVEESKDRMNVGDYIVMREGDTYIQDGRTFEAVWTLVESTLTDLGEFLQTRKEIEQ
jgi:hypothetical protein